MEIKDFIEKAFSHGFTNAGKFNVSDLEIHPEVRDMCTAEKCDTYGKNWMCPPGCESVEVLSKRLERYSYGVVLQTTGQLEDEFDFEALGKAYEDNRKSFASYIKELRESCPGILPLSSDTCTICDKCTYPDEPCRFPSKAIAPIESYGLLVSQMCKAAGVPYYYGKLTITYTSCFFN